MCRPRRDFRKSRATARHQALNSCSVSSEGRPTSLVRFGRGEGLWEAGGDWAVGRPVG